MKSNKRIMVANQRKKRTCENNPQTITTHILQTLLNTFKNLIKAFL